MPKVNVYREFHLPPHRGSMRLDGIDIEPPEPPVIEPEALTLELTVPPERVAGDLLVALISTDANPTIAEPSGWALEDQIGGSAKASIHLRLADGTEPTTYTWTLDGAEDAVGQILLLKKVHPTEYVHAKENDSGTDSTISVSSITTTIKNALLITLVSLNDGELIDPESLPKGQTSIWIVDTSGQQVGSVGSAAHYIKIKKAGTTTPYDLETLSGSPTDYYVLQIAFAPLRSDPPPAPTDDGLLLEADDFLLLEIDDYILLE